VYYTLLIHVISKVRKGCSKGMFIGYSFFQISSRCLKLLFSIFSKIIHVFPRNKRMNFRSLYQRRIKVRTQINEILGKNEMT